MAVLDLVVPFLFVIAFCVWELVQLRRHAGEKRKPPTEHPPDSQ